MPRVFQMSWISSPKWVGWMKEYKKKKYAVSCRQLGAPSTKEGSYQRANAWWEAKKAEIDGYSKPADPHTDRIVQAIEGASGETIENREHLFGTFLRLMQEGRVPSEAILGPERVEQLRRGFDALTDTPSAPPERTIAAYAEAWLGHQQALVVADQMSPDRAGNNRTCLARFQTFAIPSADVDTINAGLLDNFYKHCLAQVAARRKDKTKGWAVSYAKEVFSVAQQFIRWLAQRDTIPLPKNIGSRSFKFGSGVKRVKTWTPEEFKSGVEESPGKLKLGLLLMANCGMTQQDVSDLQDSEVDWTEGRIIRKQSKTDNFENVPTVCYKLWDQTFALLKKYRSGSERVLLTESGLPYVRKELKDNGKTKKADGFASNWVHVKKRLKFDCPLKELRKLGATMLENHKEYGRYAQYFLGQSPRTVAAKHYIVPSQPIFDEAVKWVGDQLGQPTSR